VPRLTEPLNKQIRWREQGAVLRRIERADQTGKPAGDASCWIVVEEEKGASNGGGAVYRERRGECQPSSYHGEERRGTQGGVRWGVDPRDGSKQSGEAALRWFGRRIKGPLVSRQN
jgi:hypothetical protein